MAQIYDNLETKFLDGLRGVMTQSGVERVDFCVGYFNLRGWNMIVDQVDALPGGTAIENGRSVPRTCRLLIGMQRPDEELIRALYPPREEIIDPDYAVSCRRKIASDFRKQLLIGLPSDPDKQTLIRLKTQLEQGKVCVKLYLKEPLHAKLYLAYRPNDFSNKIIALMGSSNLTYSGFKGQGELNADFTDSDHVEKLSKWFNARWDDRFSLDITEDLIKVLDDSWASEKIIPPYYIYLKTAYHLSEDARSGINEFTLTPEFRSELFDFQQTAVKIAARHLRNDKRGGAMIGDVVGLGKTITACAIAKIFETNFAASTLIICPANLQQMWKKYVAKYDLKAEVMSMSKNIDVDAARYYRLVIIDESHNLRSGSGGKRYANIKQLIDHQDCKVLLLTATPYNKDFSDLANQLKLFISEDQDLGIRPEEYIRSLGGERGFLQNHSEIFIRSIKAFEQSPFTEDWNELMKLFLVRRTRTFIKNYYSKEDPSNGRRYLEFSDGTRSYFPERVAKAIKFETVQGDQYSRLYSEEMVDKMIDLRLPRYGLVDYINSRNISQATVHEQRLMDNLSRAGRRMMGFCKSTFFKRIDSSGFAFLLTLYRHILRNMVFVYAIDNALKLPIGDENALPDEFLDDDDLNATIFEGKKEDNILSFPTDLDYYRNIARSYYSDIETKNNLSWLPSEYFSGKLRKDLIFDCKKIISMIELCGPWQSDNDKKLDVLENMLRSTHAQDKVVVFTQYSDTARYIYRELRHRGIGSIECVTGSSENPTASVEKFSPQSNGKGEIPSGEQTRVLIATDVLSEGQNLQDAHVVVNYDLPWAIIRLIQRAGRVDRIGQKESRIFCYSFFPADGVEDVIRLRQRLSERINQNANILGSDEIFFEGNEQNLKDMFNERSGVLDDEEDGGEVDLSSKAYQIWKNATDANPSLRAIIPALADMKYSTKAATAEKGVITYARTASDFDTLTWLSPTGEIVSQSQSHILQALECDADTPALESFDNHFDLVSKAVEQIGRQSTATSVGGIIGSRFSTRYRIIQTLEQAYQDDDNLFYDEQVKNSLKLAIDEIYNNPLLDSSKTILGQMLRNSSRSEQIVEEVLEMRRSGNLCHLNEDQSSTSSGPRIICSMGLR